MNHTTRFILIIVTLILTVAGIPAQHVNAPKWKQIRLMHSTRDDVEKLLGPSKFRGYFALYNLDDGVLQVDYYPFDSCTDAGADLRVPKWTVVQITFESDNPVKLPDLKLDLKKFKKVKESPDVPDLITYLNEKEGVGYTIDSNDDTLNSVRYFPGKNFNRLRCKQSRGN